MALAGCVGTLGFTVLGISKNWNHLMVLPLGGGCNERVRDVVIFRGVLWPRISNERYNR